MFFVYNCAKKFDKRYDMIALSLNIEPSLLGKALGAMNETLAKIDPNARLTLKEIVTHQFIANYVPNADEKLFLPTQFKCSPFVISKNSPNEEYDDNSTRMTSINNTSTFNGNNNSGGEDYKDLYEKLKISYEKLQKEIDDMKIEMKEKDSQAKREINYLKQSKQCLIQDLDKKVQTNLEQARTIAILNEEIKHLNEKTLTNEKIIKEVIVNLKNNFIHLNNHDKKMFLERFVKEIKVRKESNEVRIESVVF